MKSVSRWKSDDGIDGGFVWIERIGWRGTGGNLQFNPFVLSDMRRQELHARWRSEQKCEEEHLGELQSCQLGAASVVC